MTTLLTFRDLLTLNLIVHRISTAGQSYRQLDLFDPYAKIEGTEIKAGAINQTLMDKNISQFYTTPLTGTSQLQRTIQKLREAGCLKPADPTRRRAPYEITDLAMRLIATLLRIDYAHWPLTLPVIDGGVDWENAVYAGEFV